MAKTLASINSRVNDIRRDTGTNSIDMTAEGFRAINAVLEMWNQMHEWEFQIDRQYIQYNKGIDYYTLNSDFKCIADLRHQKYPKYREFEYLGNNNFDSETQFTKKFSISDIAQTKRIRISCEGSMAQINTASIAGTVAPNLWVGASAISNLATDSYEYIDLGSSLKFDYSGTSGTLTNSTFTSVDLRKYKARSNVYLKMNLPSVSNFTSVSLKWGSDSSNYWSATATTTYLGLTPTANVWEIYKFAWTGSTTKTGTPDESAIDYLQVTLAYGSNPSMTDVRIENIFVSENIPLEVEYYTNSMVIDISASNAKLQEFNDSAATGDIPLWSGTWDWVNEAFCQAVSEPIFWITGEYTDMAVAQQKIQAIVDNLKTKLPSRRRYPSSRIKFDIY